MKFMSDKEVSHGYKEINRFYGFLIGSIRAITATIFHKGFLRD